MLPDTERRASGLLRPIRITPAFVIHPEGSALIECGNTRVVCTATIEDKVPPFLRGAEKGWVTAEYGMLPRSTATRMIRESSKGRPSGRTQEISRLIGRSLRSVVDLAVLKERTIWLDCDVLQADGGTRTAAITGAFVAMALAVRKLMDEQKLEQSPIRDFVAAISVGIVGGSVCLDLCYEEDVRAEVDMNVVMTGLGRLVEVQGTAEGEPFSRQDLDHLLDRAGEGISRLVACQRESLTSYLGDISNLFPSEAMAHLVSAGDS